MSSHLGTGYQNSKNSPIHTLNFRIRKESAAEFPAFFTDLDEYKDTLGINTYAIVQTTLEEVFLRMALEEVERVKEFQPSDLIRSTELLMKNKEKAVDALANETLLRKFRQQLYALLVKRALIYRHDIIGLISTIIIPVTAVGLIVGTSKAAGILLPIFHFFRNLFA